MKIEAVETVHALKFGRDLPRSMHRAGGEEKCRFVLEAPFLWIHKYGEWQAVPLLNIKSVHGTPDAEDKPAKGRPAKGGLDAAQEGQ